MTRPDGSVASGRVASRVLINCAESLGLQESLLQFYCIHE